MPDGKFAVKLALPGLYNIYNALAATGLGYLLELSEKDIIHVLEGFETGFGRMETVNVMDREIKMILVKNPTGFNQVLRYMMTQNNRCVVTLALNDKLADGTDISWIWMWILDSFFHAKKIRFYVSGDRAEDMAVRLKYAGIDEELIRIEHNENQLIDKYWLKPEKMRQFIFFPPILQCLIYGKY